jgi:hypothetical protein
VPFRRVQERTNEIELLIFVTPEFCEAMDAHEVPPCGPGQHTTSPTDCELYFRGYLEVPKNCDGNGMHGIGGPEVLPPVQGGPPTPPKGARVAPPAANGQGGMQASNSTRRSGAIGSGAPARTISTTRATDPTSGPYSPGAGAQRPSAGATPVMIGPLGYDELR